MSDIQEHITPTQRQNRKKSSSSGYRRYERVKLSKITINSAYDGVYDIPHFTNRRSFGSY